MEPRRQISDLFGVFFPPVLMNNNRRHNNAEKRCAAESNVVSHIYFPVTKEPKITIAKIKLAALKKALAKFSRCFFVNLIKDIIQPATGFVKRFLRVQGLKGDFKRRAVIGTVPITLSDLLGVFFPPVLMNNNRRHNNAEKHCAAESNVVSHIYSPLSKIVPIIMKSIQKIIPKISFGTSNSFVTKEPKITIAKMKLAALKNTFAKFFRCFFVNFTEDIIQQATGFVKRT